MPTLDLLRAGPASGGTPRQLVMLLHGVGADSHDLIDLAQAWRHALPHSVFAAPDAPEPYDGAPFGRQWFSLADRTPAMLQAGAQRAVPMLDATIDAELARLGLPGDALALMGFSQGAMMALFAGLRRTPAPRGILAYSGALLDAAGTALAAPPPVLLVHGEVDEVVPFARGPAAEATLRRLGVPVESLWCPRLGHGIDEAGIAAGALFLQRVFAAA